MVEIGVAEGGLVAASFIVYILPVAALFVGAGLGTWIARRNGIDNRRDFGPHGTFVSGSRFCRHPPVGPVPEKETYAEAPDHPGRGGVPVKKEPGIKVVTANKKARMDYFIEDTFEAGMSLMGTEVKSLREGRANLKDSYAREKDGRIVLVGAHISPYPFGNRVNHEPERERQLLLHKQEIKRLIGKDPGAGLYPRAAGNLLQERKGQARDRAGQGQGAVRQARGDQEAGTGSGDGAGHPGQGEVGYRRVRPLLR